MSGNGRPKAYSYIRMSTDIQLKGDSLRRQLEKSRRYAEQNDLDLIENASFHDIGKSGYTGENLKSGGLGRILNDVKEGRIAKGSYLLVESLDRISRQSPLDALVPFRDIIKAGITIVTLIDKQTYTGDISDQQLIGSLFVMANSHRESKDKGHRVGEAWANKRKNAATKKLTAKCPGWLELSEDRSSFTVLDDRAAIVRRIFDEAIAGLGAYSIVKRLNADEVPTFLGRGGWQTSTVNRIIGSKSVIGEFQPGKVVNGKRVPDGEPYADYFPAIISNEDFDRAQRSRLTRLTKPQGDRKGSGGRKGDSFSNLFTKLAKCAYCHGSMVFRNKGLPPKGFTYLICSNADRKSGCSMNSAWRYDHFEKAFLTFVEKLDLASIVSAEKQGNKRSKLRSELEAAEGKLKRLMHERERTFESLIKLDNQSDFLAQKVQQYEIDIKVAEQDQQRFSAEIAQLDSSALEYYADEDRITNLIEQVRSVQGSSVYKVRSQIAARLQAMIVDLRLTVALGDDDHQQFEVNFRDGAHLMVFVDPKNPATIDRIVRSDGNDLVQYDAAGNEIDRY